MGHLMHICSEGKVSGPSHGTSNSSITSTTTLTGGVEVKCKNCYLSGLASAEINIESASDDLGTVLNDTAAKVYTQVNETVRETFNALDTYFSNHSNWDDYFMSVYTNIEKDGLDLEDFWPPNLNVSSFDDDLEAAIPYTTMTFRFDDLDVYLELETILDVSAVYTLKMIPPGVKPYGIDLPNNVKLGITFSADLILAIDGSLDITGGLHIKVDDHVALRLQLFGNEVSDMEL